MDVFLPCGSGTDFRRWTFEFYLPHTRYVLDVYIASHPISISYTRCFFLQLSRVSNAHLWSLISRNWQARFHEKYTLVFFCICTSQTKDSANKSDIYTHIPTTGYFFFSALEINERTNIHFFFAEYLVQV